MPQVSVVQREGVDRLGEGPHWSVREQALYWVDILGQVLHRYDPATSALQSWPTPERIGWVLERTAGGFIAGLKSGFFDLALEPFELTAIGDPEPDRPDNRLNDAKVDAAGRIWAGSKDDRDLEDSGALWRLDPDRTWRRADDGYRVTNGPAFNLAGDRLYHTDSGRRVIYRFDVDAEGGLHDRRTHILFDDAWGHPDGMTTDAEDCLWVAHWGGARISRFDPTGERMQSIELPASQITSCAFGGPALDRLFVTSAADGMEHEPLAGALFEVDPGVVGLAPHRFGG